jgi:hypothetical protein
MIEVYPDSKIYVACPANVATGGPELLHQLAYHLRKDLSIDAYMYYYNFDDRRFETPVHPEYKMYGNPFVTNLNEVEDIKKNIIIVPEVRDGINLLQYFKNIRKGVWFLSVGNYYLSKPDLQPMFQNTLPHFGFDLSKVVSYLSTRYDYRDDPFVKLANFYLFQSYYAMNHFSDLSPKYYLSDNINIKFFEVETDLSKKENIVVFNGNKAIPPTLKLVEEAKDIQFVPIKKMPREEVIKLLQKAKVYIDFGHHPGKDRLPREAAILGCCVITGKRGSAAFFEDVPIPDEYKFEDKEESIPEIINKIKDCFENYEERYKDFEYYRQFIKNEPQKFLEDLRKIFIKVEK